MFITNTKKDSAGAEQWILKKRINDILPYAKSLDVLVGFFYFSGFNEVADVLRENKDIKLRILVGMDAEVFMGKAVEIFRGDGKTPKDDAFTSYLSDLHKVVNTKMADAENFAERAHLFCDMLESGRMEIRKTSEPNHAKLYIFSMRDAEKNGVNTWITDTWITGSSNFSSAGLGGRAEFDLELREWGYENAKAYFETCWEAAIELTPNQEAVQKIVHILKNESPAAEVSPYEAYLLLLKNYVEARERVAEVSSVREIIEEPKNGNVSRYSAFEYQMDAVRQANSIIDTYNGVIIADVVGLGKSVIGSVLGRVRRVRGLVIAPPSLVESWKEYLSDWRLSARWAWEVRSRGKLDEVAEFVRDEKVRGDEFRVIVVDEAHYFRNEDTQDYELLSQICRGKEVILMTATPFSNRPEDVLALLKLFMPTRGAPILEDGNLEDAFEKFSSIYDNVNFCKKNMRFLNDTEHEKERTRLRDKLCKVLSIMDLGKYSESDLQQMLRERLAGTAREIKELVGRVMIRRNRLDLLENPRYREEVGERISKIENPQEQLFELSEEQSEFYDKVIKTYFGEDSEFSGAAYHPIDYTIGGDDLDETDDDNYGGNVHKLQQQNMYKFIRRLLVRRFESSFFAFKATLENLKKSYDRVMTRAFKRNPGYVPVSAYAGKLLDYEILDDADLFESDFQETQNVKELRENGQLYSIKDDFDDAGRERFRNDLEKDIKLFEKILKEVEKMGLCENDPKADKLIAEVKNVLAGTLGKSRGDAEKRKVIIFSEFRDTVEAVGEKLKKAFPNRTLVVTTLSNGMRRTLERNFDASACNQCDDFDIMIATDKMSEGFNLNRAGVVVNYDIPWNPVRVIQRVGRINRIGKKVFEELFIFNFYPTERGASIARQREIAAGKMFMIHTSIGEDAKIFSEDEVPSAAGLYQKLSASPEENEQPSFWTQAKKLWETAKEETPELVARIEKFPLRVKTAWKNEKISPQILLFSRRGNALFATVGTTGSDGNLAAKAIAVEDAINLVKCTKDTPRSITFSENFWKNYQELSEKQEKNNSQIEGTNSIFQRALRRLQLELAAGACGNEAEFAKDIVDDIQSRRTLPVYTLKEIADTKKHKSGEDFQRYLSRLSSRVGSLKFDREKQPLNCLIAEDLQ